MPNPVFNVLFLNDDLTPMEFVANVLQDFFGQDYDEAIKMMLRVHHEGKAICGTYEREQAEALTGDIMAFAAKHNHPLRCILEEVP